MSIESIVQVTISSTGRGISRKAFGIPMVVAVHSNFPELARQYNLGTALSDMINDGFTANDPAHLAVAALARNTPKPDKVIVGKLLTAFNHLFEIEVPAITAVGGELYELDIISPDGTKTTISYIAIAADSETVIAAALDSQVDAIAGLTSTSTLGVISAAADSANALFFTKRLDPKRLEFRDTTVDTNLVTEVTAIDDENSAWYGLILADPNSAARITALASYTETKEKIFGATTPDTEVGNGASTTDIAFTLKASSLFRTYLVYSADGGNYAAATWMGERFPFDPGGSTWAFKTLSGVTVDNVTSTFVDAVHAKNGNTFTALTESDFITQNGTMASGEFIDVIRGRDWLTARLRERVFGLLKDAPKVPYTDAGIDQVKAQVEAQMNEGIGAFYLSPDIPEGQAKPYIVTAPAAADVDSTVKASRLLPDVAFETVLAGAIHAVQISGNIRV